MRYRYDHIWGGKNTILTNGKRRYCMRRLHRIRKALKFTHGKNRFQKRNIEPENVKDERYSLSLFLNFPPFRIFLLLSLNQVLAFGSPEIGEGMGIFHGIEGRGRE